MPEPNTESTTDRSPTALPETTPDVHAESTTDHAGPRPIPLPEPTVSVPGYEVLGVLGRGGMGVVYKARQLGLNRLVALKMIRSGADADELEIARFRSEAETAARLQHPHIVSIHEVGEVHGQLFCALEFVEGGSLASRLAGAPLPSIQAAALLETLAQAVQAAHEAGVVHRDLKPANILLASPGRQSGEFLPKIADFGLARRLDEPGLTQTGQVLGTPSYMAPEQASGQANAAGPAADIYALGAVLYETLTGRPPFRAASILVTLEQVRSQEPVPPSRLEPTVPRDLETICLKCLQKEPHRRYASALALAEDLQRFLRREPILARPVGAMERAWKWARRKPVLASLAGGLILSFFGLAILVAVVLAANRALEKETEHATNESERADARAREADEQRQHATRQVIRLHLGVGGRYLESGDLIRSLPSLVAAWREEGKLAPPEGSTELELHRLRLALVYRQTPRLSQLWSHDYPIRGAMLTANGERAISWSLQEIQVRSSRTGAIGRKLNIPPGHAALEVLASSNGQRLAIHSIGTVGVHDLTTGKMVFERRAGSRFSAIPQPFALSPDGKFLALGAGKNVSVWEVETGQQKPWAIELPGEVKVVRFSPDGSQIVTGGLSAVGVWNTRTGARVWSTVVGRVADLVVSPTGKYVAATGTDTLQVWRLDTGQPLRKDLPALLATQPSKVVFSPREDMLFTASENYLKSGEVRRWRLPAMRPDVDVLPFSGGITALTLTPDGSTLALATGNEDVHFRTAATFSPCLTPLPQAGRALRASFSPDGRLLLLCTEQQVRLWDLAVGVSGSLPVEAPGILSDYAVSPTGRLLIWCNLQPQGLRFRLHDLGTAAALSPEVTIGDRLPKLVASPDCTRVAISLTPLKGKHSLRVWDLRKPQPVPLSIPVRGKAGPHLLFSQDGRWIAFSTWEKGVEVWDTEKGVPVGPIIQTPGAEFALSPGGRRIAFSREKEVQILDCATGQKTARLFPAPARSRSLEFSPKGRFLLTWSESEARVWDSASGQPVSGPLSHHHRLETLSLSPDGRILATISKAPGHSQVHLWDVSRSRPLCSPVNFHGATLSHLNFRPDGRLLVASGRGVCCVLDAWTGERVSPVLVTPDRLGAFPMKAVFSPDGRYLRAISNFRQPSVLHWDLAPLSWRPEELGLLSGLLAGQQLSEEVKRVGEKGEHPLPGGMLEPVSPRQQVKDWERVRKTLPKDWRPGRGEVRAWREESISYALFQKQFALALSHLDALIEASPDDLELRLNRINALRELRRIEDALGDATRLIARHPGRAEVWSARAETFATQGRWDRAEADFSEAVKRPRVPPETWHARGMARVHLGRWAEAASDFAEALKHRPGKEEWWADRVLAVRNTGDQKATAQAIGDAWRDWLRETPQGLPTSVVKIEQEQLQMVRLAVLLPVSDPEAETVRKIAEGVWRQLPRKLEPNLQYGAALFRAGQPDQAFRHLSAVYKAKQGEWTVRAGFFLAMTLHREGKKEEAKKRLEEAAGRMDLLLKTPAAGQPLSWRWKAEVSLLRSEAEAVCGVEE